MFTINSAKNHLQIGQFSIFNNYPIVHGITTKSAGVSKGVYEGLNLALHVEDVSEDVVKNRQLLCDALGVNFTNLTTCQQVHGHKVSLVTKENMGAGSIEFANTIRDTDALITNVADIPLILFFADCTPLLIYDPVHQAIGVAHAGWRGTVGKIGEKTILAMKEAFKTRVEDVLVGIGPSIGKCCYEVGENVVEGAKAALGKRAEETLVFNPKTQKYHFDMWKANRLILENCGVLPEHIDNADTCTSCNSDTFYSYRADNGRTGRISAIMALKSK